MGVTVPEMIQFYAANLDLLALLIIMILLVIGIIVLLRDNEKLTNRCNELENLVDYYYNEEYLKLK